MFKYFSWLFSLSIESSSTYERVSNFFENYQPYNIQNLLWAVLVLENEWRAKKQDTNQEKDIFQERVLHCRRTLSFYGFIGLSDLLRGGCFGYEPGVWVYNIVCSIHLGSWLANSTSYTICLWSNTQNYRLIKFEEFFTIFLRILLLLRQQKLWG